MPQHCFFYRGRDRKACGFSGTNPGNSYAGIPIPAHRGI